MKPTSRNNDHLRSDDGRTHTHSPIPLKDSAHLVGWAGGECLGIGEADSNIKTCLEGPYFKPEEDCTEGTSYVKLETNTSWQVIVDLVSIDLLDIRLAVSKICQK